MRVERHWWNGNRTGPERRDVYLRTDGDGWEVVAQVGGTDGRSTVKQCPSRAAALILANAYLGGHWTWRELQPDRSPTGR